MLGRMHAQYHKQVMTVVFIFCAVGSPAVVCMDSMINYQSSPQEGRKEGKFNLVCHAIRSADQL